MSYPLTERNSEPQNKDFAPLLGPNLTQQGFAPPSSGFGGSALSYPTQPHQGQIGAPYPVSTSGYPAPPPGYAPSGPGYPPSGPGYPPSGPGYPPGPLQLGPGYYPPPAPGYIPGGPPQPITNQPSAAQGWMVMPQGPPNCPAGLEYLSMIDQLLVHQKVELLEAFTGFETKNKFTIKNSLGQKVYYAKEDSGCCTRCCCGAARPFEMNILDNYGNEIIRINRPFACSSCCCPCCPCCCPWCLESMEVYAPPGNLIGKIDQDCSICIPQFSIKNTHDETVLQIKGPLCKMNICGDVKFKVYTADGERKVGKISKQWSGLAREVFTDADHFGITFPMDLDVRMKAVMLGACFLIDIMYFEKGTDDNRSGATNWFTQCLFAR